MHGRRIALAVISLGLMALVLSPGVPAQDKAKNPPASPAAKKTTRVNIDCKGPTDIDEGPPRRAIMSGGVVITHEDTKIVSDKVTYDWSTDSATAPVAIKITNTDCDVSGSKGAAYFRKKLGVVEGNVVMLLKPKPGESAASTDENSLDKFKQPTTVTCKRIEYFYAKKVASAQGEVVIKQTKRTAYADKAVYDQKTETLVLSGNVRAVDDNGSNYNLAGDVTISLKKGAEGLRAPKGGGGSFQIDVTDEGDE